MNSLGIPDTNQANHLGYTVDNLDFRKNYIFQNSPMHPVAQDQHGALEKLTPSIHESISGRQNVLLIGCDPRYEGSLLNVHLRRQYLLVKREKPLNIFSIGQPLDLTYSHKHLGNGVKTLISLCLGKNIVCESFLCEFGSQKGQEPLILLGFSLLRRQDAQAIVRALNH
jgi:hypothetical protein